MRRALAIAAFTVLAAAPAAQAETWKPYGAVSDKGLQWSYDADYSYRDQQSGKVVVRRAGAIAVHCVFHPAMTSKLTVAR